MTKDKSVRISEVKPDELVHVVIETDNWRELEMDFEAIATEMILATLNRSKDRDSAKGEVSISLANDRLLRDLNFRFREIDAATNILAFPDAAPAHDATGQNQAARLGDLALAFETVTREARAQGKPVEHHFRHLIVHGALHLLGYDHIEEQEASAMEALERLILAEFNVPDPYAGDEIEVG